MPNVDEDTIVVGIDGSDASNRALIWALAEAERSNRSLLLVHVWHWTSDAVGSPMSLIGMPDSRTSGRRLLGAAAARAKARRVGVATRLIEGQRANALAEIADGSAMLVVGAHGGHKAMGRTLVGSVSRGCLRHARCPVVVIGATACAPKVTEAALTR